jgi:hypothetical protein
MRMFCVHLQSIVKESFPATPALPETSTASQSLPEVDQLKLSDAPKEDDGGVMTEGKDADSEMPQDDFDEDGVTEDLGDRGDSALKDIFRSKSVELKYQYKPGKLSLQ